MILLLFSAFLSFGNIEGFQQMRDHAVENGESLSLGRQLVFIGVERIVPSVDVAHTADYFNVVHRRIGGGQLLADHVSVVHENWRVTADGHWDIDQWTFRFTLDGELRTFFHSRLLRETTGRILESESFVESAEVGQSKWDAVLGDWVESL